jgi:hypothetical protein
MNTPYAILNLRSTSDPVASIKYFSNRKKVTASFDGLATGLAVGSAQELADLLLAGHHDRHSKRVCRTAVISVQTPADATQEELEDIDRRLLQAAADLKLVLGVASMLGWVHGNTLTRHIHLIFGNSNGRRTMDLRPKLLRQLQGFLWTAQLLSGRGKGRRKALSVYPRSRKLVVRDLADFLLDDGGNLRRERWEQLLAAGKVGNVRLRKNGSPISFECEGRRIRFSTLKGFITEQLTHGKDNTMPVELTSLALPVPAPLLASLSAVGVAADAVNRVVEDFRDAHHAQELEQPRRIVPQPPKMDLH